MSVKIRRPSKLKNIHTQCKYGHKHRSGLEASVCHVLHMRMQAKEISEITCEDHICLTEAKILYVVDFRCKRPDGSYFWVEAKGYPDAKWPIKMKLWEFYGPGDLEIWKGTSKKPFHEHTIQSRIVWP